MGFKARPLKGTVSSKLIVAGVLALDDLKTPKRSEKAIVGGAGVYSSISSSFFTNTALIAAIGNDFPNGIVNKLRNKKINLDCVKTLDYPTFHWSGEYVGDMSQAITHETDYQINDHYNWEVNENYNETDFVLVKLALVGSTVHEGILSLPVHAAQLELADVAVPSEIFRRAFTMQTTA